KNCRLARAEIIMPSEINKQIALEIAHVLFIDIVGYSKLSINEQNAAVDELTQIVRSTEQFQKAEAADRLIKIATGDGMALVFYTSPEAPVRCAIELSRALKDHPRLRVRMGIHSGPVSEVGNPQLPKKLQAVKKHRTRVRWAEMAVALLMLAAITGAFVFLLRRPPRSGLAIPEKSIAVLPFDNLSEEKGNAYFANGTQNEILTKLA